MVAEDMVACMANLSNIKVLYLQHDDVIKWKHFPRYWPFVRGIHRSPVDSPHKGQDRGALMFSLICAWTNGWANNRDAADLRRHHTHYDITVMSRTCVYPEEGFHLSAPSQRQIKIQVLQIHLSPKINSRGNGQTDQDLDQKHQSLFQIMTNYRDS